MFMPSSAGAGCGLVVKACPLVRQLIQAINGNLLQIRFDCPPPGRRAIFSVFSFTLLLHSGADSREAHLLAVYKFFQFACQTRDRRAKFFQQMNAGRWISGLPQFFNFL